MLKKILHIVSQKRLLFPVILFCTVFVFLFWSSILVKATTPVFNAEYFDNLDLSGTPVLTRAEGVPNYDWGLGSPDSIVPSDNFSARWSANHSFTDGTYRFVVAADDGVRLYIDNQLVIDRWNNHSPTAFSITTNLTNGEHLIVMEYYDGGYTAIAKLDWKIKNLDNEFRQIMPLGDSITHGYSIDGGYRTKLFSLLPGVNFLGTQVSGPQNLDDKDHEGHLGWTINEISSQIFNWFMVFDPDTVLLLIGTNDLLQNYQVDSAPSRLNNLLSTIRDVSPTAHIFVGTLPPLGTESQNQLVNTFNQQLASVISARQVTDPYLHLVDINGSLTQQDLTDGIHPNLAGYEKMATTWATAIQDVSGQPLATPTPTPTPLPPGDGFSAEYFDNINLQGTPVLTRNEAVVDNDWGTSSPDPSLPIDNFSVRWSKIQNFTEGTYRFTVTADDGVRLKVDGQTVIDKWIDQPATAYPINLNLTQGDHEIVMEYYERGWGAVAKLNWSIL